MAVHLHLLQHLSQQLQLERKGRMYVSEKYLLLMFLHRHARRKTQRGGGGQREIRGGGGGSKSVLQLLQTHTQAQTHVCAYTHACTHAVGSPVSAKMVVLFHFFSIFVRYESAPSPLPPSRLFVICYYRVAET